MERRKIWIIWSHGTEVRRTTIKKRNQCVIDKPGWTASKGTKSPAPGSISLVPTNLWQKKREKRKRGGKKRKERTERDNNIKTKTPTNHKVAGKDLPIPAEVKNQGKVHQMRGQGPVTSRRNIHYAEAGGGVWNSLQPPKHHNNRTPEGLQKVQGILSRGTSTPGYIHSK